MKCSKGDLIAIRTIEDRRVSAVVVSLYNRGQFLYCYILETDTYRLVYEGEVEFVITNDFGTDMKMDHDIYNLDYSFYEACSELFAYSPFYGSLLDEEDLSEEDE